jgi:hypothetical protein
VLYFEDDYLEVELAIHIYVDKWHMTHPFSNHKQPQTTHSHFITSTSTPPLSPPNNSTQAHNEPNCLIFSSPPDKPPPQHRINSNSHLTNSSSSEMIAATNRPCVSRNNNNNNIQTHIGGSTGDRTAITPHSSRANYHPPYNLYYNSSQSDASDSEQEDIQHASAPK